MTTTESTPARKDVFATTRWTLVLEAGRKSSPQAALALEELCRTYWYPLYVYVRHHGHSREDAEDLTQAFFTRLLEKKYLQDVRSERGKFRAFLLTALKHFLANEWDRSQCQKRGGQAAALSLDWQDADTRYRIEPAHYLTPEKLYERTWAIKILEQVITRLRESCEAEGKAITFQVLQPFLSADKGAIPYAHAAAILRMSEGAVRVAVHRLRRRYRELLRQEISQTLSDPSEIEGELQSLFRTLSE